MSSDVGDEKTVKLFGQRLQDARRKAGITQQDLSDRAELSYSTLAKIERGAIRSPSVFTVEKIADCLNTSVDSLLGRQAVAEDSGKKTSKNGIKFVYFDINGCLVRFFHRAFTKLSEESGIPLDKIESVFWRYNDDVNNGKMTMDEFNNILADKLGCESIVWQDYYLNAVEPIEEMHELLEWAIDNFKVGLISNIMPGVIGGLLERELVPNVNYDVIIDSSKVESIKPEKKIYEIAEQEAGVNPEEILLIDDTRANLMAAERMGWKVLWFDDYRPSEGTERIKKVLEI